MSVEDFRTRLARNIPAPHLRRRARFAGYVLLAVAAGFAALQFWGPAAEPADADVPVKIDGIALTAGQQKAAGIAVQPIRTAPLRQIFRAPGEVQTNGYTAGIVAARVTASVV